MSLSREVYCSKLYILLSEQVICNLRERRRALPAKTVLPVKYVGGNIVIRRFTENDLITVMEIWLETNIKAHNFIPKGYWTDNYAAVKEILPHAEVYVYEDDDTHQIFGFIGLTNNYIAGIFTIEAAQSKGIGKQLLDYVKEIKSEMSLSVYQKNIRAIAFYKREQFIIQSENIDNATNEKEFFMTWTQKC